MNSAVKDVWKERGWLAEGEDILTETVNPKHLEEPSKFKINTKAVNGTVKNYKDKWQINNNIKVEWVEGKIAGVDGNTSATTYLGKKAKKAQEAIAKKKLQISKLEDKITMEEGGNKAVADPLDNLKEELRIAQNELKELEKIAKKENILPDITIKINIHAKNPYAVFRSELEHARDIAKGSVPNQEEKHFSRYNGKNESEMSLEYVKKKADKRASNNIDKPSNELKDTVHTSEKDVTDVKENSSNINKEESQTNTVSENNLSNNKGQITLTEFSQNRSITWVHAGKLLENAYYKTQEWFNDIKFTVVEKMTTEEITKDAGNSHHMTGYVITDEKGGIIKIKVHPNSSPEDIEKTILHEIRHTQQDPSLKAELEDIAKNIDTSNEEVVNKYYNHPLEKDAREWAEQQQKAKADFNGRTTNETADVNKLRDTSTVSGMQDRGRDSSLGVGETKPRVSSTEETATTTKPTTSDKPTSERIKDTNGDLNGVDKVIDDVINSDPELSGTDFKALAEDADTLYNRLKTVCGDNLLAFKKAFGKGWVSKA